MSYLNLWQRLLIWLGIMPKHEARSLSVLFAIFDLAKPGSKMETEIREEILQNRDSYRLSGWISMLNDSRGHSPKVKPLIREIILSLPEDINDWCRIYIGVDDDTNKSLALEKIRTLPAEKDRLTGLLQYESLHSVIFARLEECDMTYLDWQLLLDGHYREIYLQSEMIKKVIEKMEAIALSKEEIISLFNKYINKKSIEVLIRRINEAFNFEDLCRIHYNCELGDYSFMTSIHERMKQMDVPFITLLELYDGMEAAARSKSFIRDLLIDKMVLKAESLEDWIYLLRRLGKGSSYRVLAEERIASLAENQEDWCKVFYLTSDESTIKLMAAEKMRR